MSAAITAVDHTARIQSLGAQRIDTEAAIAHAISDARSDGVSWSRIGRALGVTHQAVIKRYGRRGGGAR